MSGKCACVWVNEASKMDRIADEVLGRTENAPDAADIGFADGAESCLRISSST